MSLSDIFLTRKEGKKRGRRKEDRGKTEKEGKEKETERAKCHLRGGHLGGDGVWEAVEGLEQSMT